MRNTCYIAAPALIERMKKKNMRNIVVEVASSNTSDFEVSEIFLRLCRDEHADYLVEKKRYRRENCDDFCVILPPYRLEYQQNVRFYIKKWWIFTHLAYEGISF